MKRFALLFVLVLLFAVAAYAAAPTTEEEGMLIFDTTGQTTAERYTVYGLAWASSASGQIAAGNSMTMIDAGTNVVIATTVASGTNDEYQITFPSGLKVSGLTLSSITTGKGKVYVNANKR
jgi:hypothetical protein